ncbi:Hypothetical protein POVN_LOCUS261 [uncultured virus]|nr:Hypothetical protein POVN_LOCUS261 [uncultured virus]
MTETKKDRWIAPYTVKDLYEIDNLGLIELKLAPKDVKIVGKKSMLFREDAVKAAVIATKVKPRWLKHINKFHAGQVIKCKITADQIKAVETEYGKSDVKVLISLAHGLTGSDLKDNRFCLHMYEEGKYKLGGIRQAALFEYTKGMAMIEVLGYPFVARNIPKDDPMIVLIGLQEAVPTTCAGCPKLRTNDMKSCSRCLTAKYCSTECFRAHWPTHKATCSLIVKPKEKAIEETPPAAAEKPISTLEEVD